MSTLALSLGAVEVGVMISSTLYGVATLQTWLYAERCSTDTIYLRLLAMFIWIFETVHTIGIWIFLYTMTVTNFGQIAFIDRSNWTFATAIPVAEIIGCAVQSFFANRVRVLSGSLVVPVIAWIGTAVRGASGIAIGVMVSSSSTMTYFLATWGWLTLTQFAVSMSIDILLTSALCFYLFRQQTGVRRMQRVMDKLVMYTVETGLMTSIFAMVILVVTLVMGKTFLNIGIFMIYPKLFSNSFFSMLNARHSLREKMDESAMNVANVMSAVNFARPRSPPEYGASDLSSLSGRQDSSDLSRPRVPRSSSSFDDMTKIVTLAQSAAKGEISSSHIALM